jgi:hypothetical protein
MMKVIVSVACAISGVFQSLITMIAISVQRRSMATEANYWNNYFKSNYK